MEIYNGTYCVYVHINKVNGKMYVGQTVYGDNPNKRWLNGHGYVNQKYFGKAVKKYGWDNFEHEVVASNLTKAEADAFEMLLIKQLNTTNPLFGYNITFGGGGSVGYHLSEESKQKCRDSMQKYYSDPAYIQKMRDVAPKRAICQFTLDGVFVNSYISIMEAQRQTNIRNNLISHCALGRLPSAGGYIFLFEEQIDEIELRVQKYKQSIKPRNEPIAQLTMDLIFIKEWPGAAEAGRVIGINYKNINLVCRGRRNKAGGYKWMYLSDYEKLNET